MEIVRGFSFEEVLEQIYKTESKTLAISQILIARSPVATQIDPSVVRDLIAGRLQEIPRELAFLCSRPQDIDNVFARFPGRSVHLLFSHNHIHYLSANINPTSTINPLDQSEAIRNKAIRAIREIEIEVIVEAGRARFPAIPGVLYEAPNGRLVRSFLRIGNIQRSRAAVDALFFWLLPHLRDCAGIITDIWSIGSIALNASRRLSSYHFPLRAPCAVEMVSSYLDGSQESAAEAADHISRLLRLASPASDSKVLRPTVVFLMSAISTGEYHSRTRKLLDHRGTESERVRFVSLFNLGINRTSVPCLVDWSKDAGRGEFAAVDPTKIKGHFDTIKIDPQTYFPTSYEDVHHVIREKEILEFRQFLDRYSDISAVKVHRTVTDDGALRHHAISIDTVTLCGHLEFQKRLRDKLLRLEPPPRLVITPVHAAGKILADTTKQILHERAPGIDHIMHPDLVLTDDRIGENKHLLDLINGIDDQSSILILDDAFISGRRLNHYQQALRHVEFRGRIHYLVGVARPSAMSLWEYRCRMLRSRSVGSRYADEGNTVSAIEAFALPDWDEDKCPWCKELQVYQIYANRPKHARLSSVLRTRRQYLEQSMHAGMSSELFLKPPNVDTLSFTRDSKFAPLGSSEASVFASVASGIQALRSPEYQSRSDKPALGTRHYPVTTVLDHKEFLFGTYTDSLLRASFLRAARDYELVYANQSEERQKTECAIQLLTSTSPIENDLSAEIIVAWLANKFPELSLSEDSVIKALKRLALAEIFGDLLGPLPRKRTKKVRTKTKYSKKVTANVKNNKRR
jgi:hypothetical protein